MIANIYWSPLAEESYLKTLAFILEKWTLKEAEDFRMKVEGLIVNLTIHHQLCPPSKSHNELRKCVISPQTSLIYRIVDKNIIELVAFINNRSFHYY